MIPLVPVEQIHAGKDRNFLQFFSLIIFSRMSTPSAIFFAVNPPDLYIRANFFFN